MSQLREIEFRIDLKTGQMTTEAIGFKGKGCKETLDQLSKEMGSKVEEIKEKAEKFQHQSDSEAEKERQKLGKK